MLTSRVVLLSLAAASCDGVESLETGGPCVYVDREATCTLDRIEGGTAEGIEAAVVWRADVSNAACSARFTVEPGQIEGFGAHMREHASAPCEFRLMTEGSCNPIQSCVVHVPAFPQARWLSGATLGPPDR